MLIFFNKNINMSNFQDFRMLNIRYGNSIKAYFFKSVGEIKNYNKVNYINCVYFELKSFPPLPNSLIYLICHNNQLNSLPKLPNSLDTIDCHNNQLTSLPKLPYSLQMLLCDNNQLTSLPELPNSLKYLICDNNKFIKKRKYKYLIKIIYLWEL
jgi:Leucine-rich repeat (LRR) protein